MHRPKTIVGLCVLCAVLGGVLGTQGASAATKGTTGFTCQEKGEGGFTDAHCKTAGSGKFQHVAIAQDTKTEVTVTNETTEGAREPLVFKTTIAGLSFPAQVKLINGVGSLENKTAAGTGEHYVTGTDMFPVEEVSAIEGNTCKVISSGTGGTGGGGGETEGTVILNVLTATTQGQGDAVKFSAAEGTALATFSLGSCSQSGTYTVVGSVKCIPEGATCKFTHNETTTAGTLRLGSAAGPKVGISGTLTFKGRANSKEAYTPIGSTTVETG